MAKITERPPVGKVEDLASLPELNEAILLEELRTRYKWNNIYTYVGDILVSVNPFKTILGLYGSSQSQQYKGKSRTECPPHIFGIADSSYTQMLDSEKHQCCLISGESGAGKTEATKLIMSHLMELCSKKVTDSSLRDANLEQKIVKVNGLLEAFGNAQTVMNDNSSRFGKYIQLKFIKGAVVGAKINEYLLEKSRVVVQAPGEQSFHIFNALFVGLEPEDKKRFKLHDPDEFNYLSNGGHGIRNKSQYLKCIFNDMESSIDLIGFTAEEQENLFRVCAGLLHFGNVGFEEKEHDASCVRADCSEAMNTSCSLLGLRENLISEMMTISVSVARGEQFQRNLNKEKASVARDSIAKSIYARAFGWIVNRINSMLAPPARLTGNEVEIGILDIFGFEHFDHNSYEQMCINLANEQLQYYFNQHIFMMELEEYKSEGISIRDVKFEDNKPILDMFLSKPIGVLALLDEQCVYPKATDETFIGKLYEHFSKQPHFVSSKRTILDTFTIKHYAGQVKYDGEGFLEKNRDQLPNGCVEMLQRSENSLISTIFSGTLTRTGTLALGMLGGARKSRKSKKRMLELKAGKMPGGKSSATLGGQFKISLQVLMEKMSMANPHFVRCIKPNHQKQPDMFVDEYVEAQLRYTGMLETTRIRKDGYALRPTFHEFVMKYKPLVRNLKLTGTAENARKILEETKEPGWQIGRTKVFMKYWLLDKLSAHMEKLHRAAAVLEKHVRGFLARKRFKRLMAVARQEAEGVRQFSQGISNVQHKLYDQLEVLCDQDMKRPKDFWKVKPKAEPPPKVTKPPTPPPQPKNPSPIPPASDSDTDSTDDSDDTFSGPVTKKVMQKKFGMEGNRAASIRWFQQTQKTNKGAVNQEGNFHEWFHGIITRRQAEKLLTGMPIGGFLIRVSETRFGYSLSVRAAQRVKHFMIDQTPSSKYVVVGEPQVHKTLAKLVDYHKVTPVTSDGDLLTKPCGQQGSLDYQELLGEDEDDYQAPAEILNFPQAQEQAQGATPRTNSGINASLNRRKIASSRTEKTSLRPGAKGIAKNSGPPPLPPR